MPVNRGKRDWTNARYLAERHEIAARYAEWEIIGLPQIRDVDLEARYFTPHRPFKEMMDAEMRSTARARQSYSRQSTRPKHSCCAFSFDGTLPIARGVAGSPQ